MSYWFYLHPELSGRTNYWKAGKSLTPYSAVRSRQRFLVDDFYLSAVWFGHPTDIAKLEKLVHGLYSPRGQSQLGSSRGELIYYDPKEQDSSLEARVEQIIYSYNLSVQRMFTGDSRGYHATNSSQCCFGCWQEKDAHEWSRRRVWELFNRRLGRARTTYDSLFV